MIDLIKSTDDNGRRVYKHLVAEIVKRAINDAKKHNVRITEEGMYKNLSDDAKLFLLGFEDSYLNDILNLGHLEIMEILNSLDYQSWGEIETPNFRAPKHKETPQERQHRYYVAKKEKLKRGYKPNNRHWYTNGENVILAEFCPEGYVLGRGKVFYGNQHTRKNK